MGRVDFFVMDRVSAVQVTRDKPLPSAGTPFSEIRSALPFRDTEADREPRERLDAALSAPREDATLEAISQRCFDSDITRP